MKEPGLDGRHRNEDGRIRQKRSDTENQNQPKPIPGFAAKTTLDQMRQETGKTSEKGIRDAVKPKKQSLTLFLMSLKNINDEGASS